MKLFLIALGLVTFGLFYGCGIRVYDDVSKNPEYSHLIHHCFELKRDVFLIYFTDSKEYVLEAPGTGSIVPESINAYYSNHYEEDFFVKVIDVIPKGTRIQLYQIVVSRTLQSTFIRWHASIQDPRYSNLAVNISFLLNRNSLENQYSIQERYLEYCNEYSE